MASYKPLFRFDHSFQRRPCCSFTVRSTNGTSRGTSQKKISKATGVFVTKMSILAFVDNFGAGMAGGLVSYWFFLRFGVELKSLGMLFFISNFLAALSFLSAPIIARWIGIVKTMAFSHGFASMIYLSPFHSRRRSFIAADPAGDPLVLRLHG